MTYNKYNINYLYFFKAKIFDIKLDERVEKTQIFNIKES